MGGRERTPAPVVNRESPRSAAALNRQYTGPRSRSMVHSEQIGSPVKSPPA